MLDLSNYTVILGSSSARRQEILRQVLKVDRFTVVKPDFEENLSKKLPPTEYVEQTSHGKLESLLQHTFTSPTIIICCDTIIDCNGTILEKPQTKAKQLEMFEYYKRHPTIKVISSVQIAKVAQTTQTIHQEVTTTLLFDTSVSQEVLEAYLDSEEGLEVAGGFKFQEMGNVLFTGIDGDYFNVVGLPAKTTFEMLYRMVKD